MRIWKRSAKPTSADERPAPVLHPERIVSRVYYGAVLGLEFESDQAAAEHYLGDGWRTGVVPHPFLDAVMVRASMDSAARLRDALREFASTPDAAVVLGGVGALVDAKALGETNPGAIEDVTRLLKLSSVEQAKVPLNGGFTWGEAEVFFAGTAGASLRVREAGFLNLEFYSAQRPRPFLTWYAGLDDYITIGERAGAIPSWIFEPEWHAAHDAAQARGSRSFNQLLEFVASGERSGTSPLLGPGANHATVLAAQAGSDTESELVLRDGMISLSAARAAVEVSFPRKPATSRPRSVPLRGGAELDVAIIVDARHLTSDAHMQDLRELAASQRVDRRAIFVVSDAGDGHEPPLEVRFEGVERLEILDSELGEPFGAAVLRVIEEHGFEAWTLWKPGQVWKDDGLIATARALNIYPDASGVGAFTPNASQDWGDPDASLWRSRLDAAGVVFRSGRILPDPGRDYGVNADAIYRLGAAGDGLVLEGDRFWARAYDANALANRIGANGARATHAATPERTLPDGLAVTVVMPTFEDWRMTLTAVRAVRETSDAGVIIVDNGSRRAVGSILRQAFLGDPLVQYVYLPVNADFAAGCDIGAKIADSEIIVFLNNDTVVRPGWLQPLLDALPGAAAAQPVLTYADGTVQTAGTVFSGGLSTPVHLLAGHLVSDIPQRVADYDFSALTGACLAMRRSDFIDVGGFDTEYINGMEDIDLCLRLRNIMDRPLRVVTQSQVRHLESKTPGRFRYAMANRVRLAQQWRDAFLTKLDDRRIFEGTDLRLAHVRWGETRGGTLRDVEWRVEPEVIRVEDRPTELRWALKIASPGTLLGDRWGDTFFGEDLAAALRRLGQRVVVDRHSAWDRPGAEHEDVNLVLRGRLPFAPLPGAINLLWVISHPDQVTTDEMRSGWDQVYSAGPAWAEQVSLRTGVRVKTLLQATDPRRFHPGAGEGAGHGVLFVGRTRGERRKVVLDAAAVSEDLAVYGDDGWEQYLEPRFIRSDILPNVALPTAYAGARVVLNDHWDDMRRGGFLSNRLFDAAAAGARIVSDDIMGLSEIFGEQVQRYESLTELQELLAETSSKWPTETELRDLADEIARHHSFDARARVLLDDARSQHAMRPRR